MIKCSLGTLSHGRGCRRLLGTPCSSSTFSMCRTASIYHSYFLRLLISNAQQYYCGEGTSITSWGGGCGCVLCFCCSVLPATREGNLCRHLRRERREILQGQLVQRQNSHGFYSRLWPHLQHVLLLQHYFIAHRVSFRSGLKNKINVFCRKHCYCLNHNENCLPNLRQSRNYEDLVLEKDKVVFNFYCYIL